MSAQFGTPIGYRHRYSGSSTEGKRDYQRRHSTPKRKDKIEAAEARRRERVDEVKARLVELRGPRMSSVSANVAVAEMSGAMSA